MILKAAGGVEDMFLLRLPSAISAMLLVFFAYGFVRTISRDETLAFLSAVVLLTNALVTKMGHTASWDIFCHSFMLGAIWAFVTGLREDRGWPIFAAAGVLMGLSFMSKGPVAFFALLLPFVIAYLWIYRAADIRAKWRLLLLAFGICIFLSALWPLYIWLFHPEALLAMADEEADAWLNRHVEPFWYYYTFVTYAGVWMVIAIAALIKPFAEKRVRSVRDYRFLLLWLCLDLVLLSVMPEKKNRYLLPAMIPLAMLTAMLLRGLVDAYAGKLRRRGDTLVVALHTLFVSLFGVLIPIMLYRRLAPITAGETLYYIAPMAAAFGIIGLLAWWLFARKRLFGLILLSAVQVSAISYLYLDFYLEATITNPQFRDLRGIDPALLPEDLDIYNTENRWSMRYVWHLNHRIKLWGEGEEAKRALERGETIGMLSVGDPADWVARVVDREIVVETISQFDYNDRPSEDQKMYLALVRLRDRPQGDAKSGAD